MEEKRLGVGDSERVLLAPLSADEREKAGLLRVKLQAAELHDLRARVEEDLKELDRLRAVESELNAELMQVHAARDDAVKRVDTLKDTTVSRLFAEDEISGEMRRRLTPTEVTGEHYVELSAVEQARKSEGAMKTVLLWFGAIIMVWTLNFVYHSKDPRIWLAVTTGLLIAGVIGWTQWSRRRRRKTA